MSVGAPARAAMGAVAIAVALAAVGCGAAHKTSPKTASCMRQPRSFSPYVVSGSRLTVAAGEIVYAVESEPEEYMTRPYPSVFPWLAPRSSNAAVLRSVRLCRSYVSGFGGPEKVFAFRGRRAGVAVLTASLDSAWRSVSRPPASFAATVSVRR